MAVLGVVLLAGCSAPTGGAADTTGRLDLTVRNDADRTVAYRLTVVDPDGVVLANETADLGASQSQSSDFSVRKGGRYAVRVAGSDWKSELAWTPDTCVSDAGTVRVTETAVDTPGECHEPR